MMWGDYDAGWWIVMWLSMLVFWGLVIAGIVIAVNSIATNRTKADSSEETLRQRLAAGEIDQEQYRTLREELRGGRPGPTAPAH